MNANQARIVLAAVAAYDKALMRVQELNQAYHEVPADEVAIEVAEEYLLAAIGLGEALRTRA